MVGQFILYYVTDAHIVLLLVRLRRFILYYVRLHSYSGAVGSGTALQTGRSRVRFPKASLGFFIELILPTALWPWDRLSQYQKWVLGYLLGGKRVACLGLTTLPPSLADCLTILGTSTFSKQPSGPLQACTGIALSLQTFENILGRARLSQVWLCRWFTGILRHFFFLNRLNRKSTREWPNQDKFKILYGLCYSFCYQNADMFRGLSSLSALYFLCVTSSLSLTFWLLYSKFPIKEWRNLKIFSIYTQGSASMEAVHSRLISEYTDISLLREITVSPYVWADLNVVE
jgi:hypothetical protein